MDGGMRTDVSQRVFKHGSPSIYLVLAIGLIAACGSGAALAMVNLVIGNFINLLSDFTTGSGVPDGFMAKVSESSYVRSSYYFRTQGH